MGKVIIDGVNVSECDRLRTYRDWTYSSDKWCGISNDGGCECKQNPDCYYKQLQRAETEIEELKKQVKNNETAYHTELGTYNMECGNLLEENKTLIAENEKLKKDIAIYKGIIDSDKAENEQIKKDYAKLHIDFAKCNEENERLKAALAIWENSAQKQTALKVVEVDKYRQALQEIREMATLFHSVNENEGLDRFKNNILDKINEVIGVDNV